MSRVFRAANRQPTPIRAPLEGTGFSAPEAVMERAKEEADRIVREAWEEAGRILEEAQGRSEALMAQAVSEGFEKGHKDGVEAALREAQGLLDQAVRTLEEAKAAFSAMKKEAEPMLVAIALDAAKRVVGEALSCDPELIVSMVREGMAAFRDETEFTVRVKPYLKDILEGSKERLRRESGAKSVEICADESIGDGYLLKTPHGFVDARVETQIANLASALGEARSRLTEEPVS
ncbi:MAG TPA: hypothetical protein GXX23_10455 [Firmicutes bacterium]|nr:hypothetical protein [Candidatus Fermentithermobacillaceae bacterium]